MQSKKNPAQHTCAIKNIFTKGVFFYLISCLLTSYSYLFTLHLAAPCYCPALLRSLSLFSSQLCVLIFISAVVFQQFSAVYFILISCLLTFFFFSFMPRS